MIKSKWSLHSGSAAFRQLNHNYIFFQIIVWRGLSSPLFTLSWILSSVDTCIPPFSDTHGTHADGTQYLLFISQVYYWKKAQSVTINFNLGIVWRNIKKLFPLTDTCIPLHFLTHIGQTLRRLNICFLSVKHITEKQCDQSSWSLILELFEGKLINDKSNEKDISLSIINLRKNWRYQREIS